MGAEEASLEDLDVHGIGGCLDGVPIGTADSIYEATATIDVDRQTPPGVVGDEAAKSALNDADQFLATQMKLVESDSVLRPVEQRFGLRKAEGQTSAIAPGHEEAPVTLKLLRVTRPPTRI